MLEDIVINIQSLNCDIQTMEVKCADKDEYPMKVVREQWRRIEYPRRF